MLQDHQGDMDKGLESPMGEQSMKFKAVEENASGELSGAFSEQDTNASKESTGDGLHSNISEDVIPTAIVIKNIPFAIKKEQLLEVIAKMELPLPYAFNYHFDNGVFRGLAFANFTTTEETTQVVQTLNGKEIGGRRLRVEYKKMLPQAERERIEREKREKRGQLEEQHRSASSASLQSLGKVPSSTVVPVNNSGAQLFNNFVSGQSGSNSNLQTMAGTSLLSAQSTAPSVNAGKHHSSGLQAERYYAPLPSSTNLPLPPQQLDFNDPDILEIYSQLLLFKDREKLYHELAYPIGLSAAQKRIINVLCSFLGLVEVYDPSFIIIRRKVLDHATLQTHLQQQGQMVMMQPLQANSTGGSLQRSQSYTSVLQAHAAATVAAAQQQQQQQRQHSISMQQQQQSQVLHQQPPQSPGQILPHTIASYDNINSSQQQQLLRPQGTTSSLLQNRIPSGYTTSHTPASSLLRQQGVSPPQNQIPMNSASSTSRMSTLLYNHSSLSQPNTPGLMSDSRMAMGLQALDSNGSANNNSGSTAPLVPQNTNGSMHSNYSVHSIHDYVPVVSAGNADVNSLEDGLTRSLSGLDLGKRNVWG